MNSKAFLLRGAHNVVLIIQNLYTATPMTYNLNSTVSFYNLAFNWNWTRIAFEKTSLHRTYQSNGESKTRAGVHYI